MADIELVIKLPDDYKSRMASSWNRDFDIVEAIRCGTPLPKGHGRLGDLDKLVKNIVKEYRVNSIHELPQDIKMFYDKFISSAPTILDATFNYKLKNYAFFKKGEEK